MDLTLLKADSNYQMTDMNELKVVSWNVNSVRKRQEQVASFLEEESPDVLCLQELKCAQDKFPFDFFSGLNYQVHVLGQKQYNGVAIFVKNNHQSKKIDFPQDEARIIGCIINSSVRVINIYAPNGAEVDLSRIIKNYLGIKIFCL